MVKHEQLDKGTGFLWHLPLRGALTCPNADNRAADADALAGLKRYVADQAVTFVEQAEHRYALWHWCHARINIIGASGGCAHFGNGAIIFGRRGLPVRRAVTRRQSADKHWQ